MIDIYDKEGNIIHSNLVPTNCLNRDCPYLIVANLSEGTLHYECKKGYKDCKECEENDKA